MISLYVINERLWIRKGSSLECKPWGCNVFNDQVVIESLLSEDKSTYSGTYSDFSNESGVFPDLGTLLAFISPFMGFKPATGGSVAKVYTQTILIPSEQVLTLGQNPVDIGSQITEQPGDGQYYNVESITLKRKGGTTAYSAETLYIFGFMNVYISEDFLKSPNETLAIAKESHFKNYDDGSATYPMIFPRDMQPYPRDLALGTFSGNDPINGDSDLELVIKYTLETF